MREIIEFNLDNVDSVAQTTDLYDGRISTANAMKKLSKTDSEVTVLVMAYNQLEKTNKKLYNKYGKNIFIKGQGTSLFLSAIFIPNPNSALSSNNELAQETL